MTAVDRKLWEHPEQATLDALRQAYPETEASWKVGDARTVLVIGIGAGDPDHLTRQAATQIGRAEVFFEIDRGVPRATAYASMIAAELPAGGVGAFVVWGDLAL